jgi:predicted acetyltransferase
MMMRVINFQGYCESISVPETATDVVVIKLNDRNCQWNTGTYRLMPCDGRLQVETCVDVPDIELTDLQLSRVVAGQVPPTALREFGEIDCSPDIAKRIEAIFPKENFVSYLRF